MQRKRKGCAVSVITCAERRLSAAKQRGIEILDGFDQEQAKVPRLKIKMQNAHRGSPA
jgi:hypothetical protein